MIFPHQSLSKNLYHQLIENYLQNDRPHYLDKDLKCMWSHHNNPYLSLGPFKVELKNKYPEIAMVHDLFNMKEMQQIQQLAQGKMVTTPYVESSGFKGFSKLRTSKVMYMNENLVKEAMILSRRIELVTKSKLSHEQYASENFQIMNYGIGGKISQHTDTSGTIFDEHYSDTKGKLNFQL